MDKSWQDLQITAKSLDYHLGMGYENIEGFLIYLYESGIFREEEKRHLQYFGIPIDIMISDYIGKPLEIIIARIKDGSIKSRLALEVLKISTDKDGLFYVKNLFTSTKKPE